MSLRHLHNSLRALGLGLIVLAFSTAGSLGETSGSSFVITSVTDKTGYNVGETVQLQTLIRNGSSAVVGPYTLDVTVRFAGGDAVTVRRHEFYRNFRVEAGKTLELDYRDLWTVREDAKTGLYEVDFVLRA